MGRSNHKNGGRAEVGINLKGAHVRQPNDSARARLKELEDSGELVNVERSYDGPLPVIHLTKPVRLDRIIKVSKS